MQGKGVIILICFIFAYSLSSYGIETIIKESFDSLDSWKPLNFPKIKRHSRYSLVKEKNHSILKCEADASASGLLNIHTFNPIEFPVLKWRWKIKNVYKKGDATKKKGDDYPLRIYIIFKYDPLKSSFFEKAKYNAAKLIYGEYPPYSSLNYIWANKKHKKKILPNPFTEKAMMIIMETGEKKTGRWVKEKVNIFEDYKKAFGKEPPHEAGLALMCDSDNTGERGESYIDYIELSRE